ncbi:hypothetical protein GPECTOR_16g743 [Gonium pectorale]|uniref:F-box domain-containing protein n=1 Tax=Gonium pectorale TaxID=33097 RepID=A0A150GLA9_GONPE|nr:hypothetical protein GPECTOR_16g743 [Gonium pectorale]|eukprot:KXZ50568.1 hypothetical protein GPECTOR_16g743 [Gonium pectorale]
MQPMRKQHTDAAAAGPSALPLLRSAVPILWSHFEKGDRLALRLCCRELRRGADGLIDELGFDEDAACKRERLLSPFGAAGCRSLTHVTLTDKLLTPGAARELLAAAPGLKRLGLEEADGYSVAAAERLMSTQPAARSHDEPDESSQPFLNWEKCSSLSDIAAAAALASGLPLVLRGCASSLTSLEIRSRDREATAVALDPAADALAECTSLQNFNLSDLSLSPKVAACLAGLPALHKLSVDNYSSLAALSSLSSLSSLSQLEVGYHGYDFDWSFQGLRVALPSDVAPVLGLRSLVELSLDGAVLGGEELRCLASLTALTRLHADILKVMYVIDAVHAAMAAPAPLSWPLPPALRHLSMDLAEVAALAALRPPTSLEVVAIRSGFCSPDEYADIDTLEQVPAGCGGAMRRAAAFLSGRMQNRALTMIHTSACDFLRGEAAPIGHTAWISELRPMGLRSLRLERLALEAGDMVQLAAAVPELEARNAH